MSLLDNVMGGMGQGDGATSVVGELLQKAGGVAGLQQMLANSGLEDQVSSWIGTGGNQAVSGGQLGQALDAGGLGDLVSQEAQKLGTDNGALLSQLSTMLPAAIDQLTPDGTTPADDGEGMDLSSLAGLAGKLFG